MNQPAAIITSLRSQGERITPVRVALIDILTKHQRPLSAPEIITKLGERGYHVNKTTVYRQLDTLSERGLIAETRFADRSVRYELKHADDDHHHHLVCTACHRVEDVSFHEDLERQEKIIQKTKHFKVQRHSLEFFGLCARCQKNNL